MTCGAQRERPARTGRQGQFIAEGNVFFLPGSSPFPRDGIDLVDSVKAGLLDQALGQETSTESSVLAAKPKWRRGVLR